MGLTLRRQSRRRVVAALVAALSLVGGLLVTALTARPAGAAGCGTANIAQDKTATASSLENATFQASNAVDGNTGTRWSSAFSGPQWLEVDLGSSQAICQVTLDWEAAYATGFQIQTSTDGSTWTTIYSTTTGTGGTQALNVSGTGQYVRMYGTTRATPYGYSLWEFQVYGSSSGTGGGGGSGGSGAPPASFWGNISAIPAARNVVEVAVVNQTNGQYPDSQVYWSFNGVSFPDEHVLRAGIVGTL